MTHISTRPDARPSSDRFRCGGRERNCLAVMPLHAVGDKRKSFGEPDRELKDIDTAGPLAEILA